jgi:hypothetical protein
MEIFLLYSNEFSENDVIADSSSVVGAGNDTVMSVVVNEPGTSTPVKNNIVEDALINTIQEDPNSEISNLTLGVVNVPTVSDEQSNNAISVRLTGTQASEVRFVYMSKEKLMGVIKH